jgi:hypothetical protein
LKIGSPNLGTSVVIASPSLSKGLSWFDGEADPGRLQIFLARVGVHGKDAVIVGEQRAIRTEVHPVWLDADAVHDLRFLRSVVRRLDPCVNHLSPEASLPSGLTLISLTSPLVVAIRYSERGFFGDFLRFITSHHAISTSDVYAETNEALSTVVH